MPTRRPGYKIIIEAVLCLRATGLYCGHWIRSDVLVQLIDKLPACQIDQALLNTTSFNNAFGRPVASFVDLSCTPNELGIFRKCTRMRTKNTTTDKIQFKKVYFFYMVNKLSSIPPNITSWENDTIKSITFFSHSLPPVKKQRLNESEFTKKSEKIAYETKWDSPEASALFLEGSAPKERKKKRKTRQDSQQQQASNVKKHVVHQIQLLRKAYLSPNGWKDIISDKDHSIELCTPHDVFVLRLKARYLAVTLTHALVMYESTTDFLDICRYAIQKINEVDDMELEGLEEETKDKNMYYIQNPRTIMEWLRIFRRTTSFPNPAAIRQCHWKNKLPAIFQNNPDLHQSLIAYARANLSTLSGELIHQYLFCTAIPGIVAKVKRETGQSEYDTAQFLSDNNLTTLSLNTVYNWLGLLGFTYSLSRKSYYVDSHEKPENTKYRAGFIKRYEAYELRTHRWVQIPLLRYNSLVKKGELCDTCGYKYKNKKDEEYVELHVDDHPSFQDESNHLLYGGNLSVRKDESQKPVMIIGQDECIFKQYTLVKKSWSDPDGMRALLPKDDGRGLMISSFVCRELGYGWDLNEEQMQKVNEQRMRGDRKQYMDETAATLKNGSSMKQKLTSTPFTRTLEYGANSEGYWTYDAMVLQLEDCMDVLQTLYPQFDFVFLFDHSNGHDRMQPDGLNMRKVNKMFGGQQPRMRSSLLNDKSCFGPYHSEEYELQPGHTQSMVFAPTDVGPFYLLPAQREKRKLDEKTGKMVTKLLPKTRLVEMLKDMNILNPVGNLKHLQAQCKALDLPITGTEEKIREGWVGKPKGSLQILYERGWVDPDKWKKYTDKGRLDEMGILMEQTSLNLLMQKQSDFATELTLLQFYGSKMGAIVDRTPKCHPELAGEGIEYIWGMAKLYYRHQPLARKRSKAKFMELVSECLSAVNITLSHVRKCSRRAREYIIAYKVFAQVQRDEQSTQQVNGTEQGTGIDESTQLNFDLIEKSIKTYKTHRNVMDFDKGFIKGLKLDVKKEVFVKEVVSKMRASF